MINILDKRKGAGSPGLLNLYIFMRDPDESPPHYITIFYNAASRQYGLFNDNSINKIVEMR
jgi:hypothetical protein